MTLGDQPAFPVIASELNPPYPGMTYRQWLVGQIAASAGLTSWEDDEYFADAAVKRADAIIKRLEEK